MKETRFTCYIAAAGLIIRYIVLDMDSTASAIICVAAISFIVLGTYLGERK